MRRVARFSTLFAAATTTLLSLRLVSGQGLDFTGSDTIIDIGIPETIRAGGGSTYNYVFDQAIGHFLRNITAELMVGKAEDNGNQVADVFWIHGADQDPVFGHDFFYPVPVSITPGDYHLRVNGTVFDISNLSGGGDPGKPIAGDKAHISTRSKSFILSAGDAPLCNTPAFTPIPSIDSPLFAPMRIVQPKAGEVFYLGEGNKTNKLEGKLSVDTFLVDESFSYGKIPEMTMEIIGSPSGEVAGSVKLNSTTDPFIGLPIDRFPGLKVGAWKVRANFTSSVHEGTFSIVSDEFFIAQNDDGTANCTGLNVSGGDTSEEGGQSQDSDKGAARRVPVGSTGIGMVATALVVLLAALL